MVLFLNYFTPFNISNAHIAVNITSDTLIM